MNIDIPRLTIRRPLSPHIFHTSAPVVFLSGSIEQGRAVDWQTEIMRSLADLSVYVLNPRRDDWDASWVQSIDNDQFRSQVEWELEGMERADIILLYLVPGTQSPISLLEFGLHAADRRLIVCCPDGFWRKGNVEIVCKRYGLPMFPTLESALAQLRAEVQNWRGRILNAINPMEARLEHQRCLG